MTERGPGPPDLERLSGLLSATGPTTRPCARRSPARSVGELPTSTAADVAAAAATGPGGAQPAWAAASDRRATRAAAGLSRSSARPPGRVRRPAADRGRQGAAERHRGGAARRADRPLLRPTARRYLHSERGEGMFPLLTRIDRHYVPKGLVGHHRALELPADHGHLRRAGRPGRRQRGAAQAGSQTPLIVAGRRRPAAARSGMPDDLWQVVNGAGRRGRPAADRRQSTTSASPARPRPAARSRPACADRLIGCSLELGGKNPLLVLDDADVETAAAGAVRACFSNAGQLCVSIERIYVAEPLHGRLHRGVRGPDQGAAARRCARLRARHGQPDQRRPAGAGQRSCRGRSGQGRHRAHRRAAPARSGTLFYEPTVLTGVTPEMDCYAEETFGPVVSIYPVADDDEAVARANDSDVRPERQRLDRRPRARAPGGRPDRTAARSTSTRASRATFGSIDAPMGGMKHSGLGRRQGREGIRRFVEVQSVGTQSVMPIAPSSRAVRQDLRHRCDDRGDAGDEEGRSGLSVAICVGRR